MWKLTSLLGWTACVDPVLPKTPTAALPVAPECAALDLDAATGALYDQVQALLALPAGQCDALLAPWTASDPLEVLLVHAASRRATLSPPVPPPEPTCGDADRTVRTGWALDGEDDAEFWAYGAAFHDPAGRFEYLADGSAGERPRRLRERVLHSGAYDEGFGGTWIRDGARDEGLYVRVDGSPLVASGDLCLVDRTSYACAAEDVGTLTVVGAHTYEITFDGDVACDGCGRLAIDGQDAGAICAG